jgi:hypothetical protein
MIGLREAPQSCDWYQHTRTNSASGEQLIGDQIVERSSAD